jgi:septin family protein
MGKSSFINSMCGKTICKEGKPFGAPVSTTYNINMYTFNVDGIDDEEDYTINIIDTIGFIDTSVLYTDR